MNLASLQGLNVLVTRPAPQQQPIREAIESLGGHAVHFPLIDIVPLRGTENIQELEQRVRALDSYQVLIFVSTNGARLGKEWFSNYAAKIPDKIDVIAVGPTTAKMVSTLFECTVMHSDTGMTSEDMLSLPVLKEVAGKHIGIVRGKGGRELLAMELCQRGAIVDYFEVYQREVHVYEPEELINVVHCEQINVFTITSAEALARFSDLAIDNKAALSLIPLVVPSARLASQAERLGYKAVRNSNGADNSSMLTVLKDIASNGSIRNKG